MINSTNKVVFSISGKDLNLAIRIALRHAGDSLKFSYNLQDVNLLNVTTKTNRILSFNKFVELGVLNTVVALGEDYVDNIFQMYQSTSITQNAFEKFMVVLDHPELYFAKTFGFYARKGFGLFLISLHSSGAITLPSTFRWPTNRTSPASVEASAKVCEESEILSFIRSVDTVPGSSMDAAFDRLQDQQRIEWFGTYATKVVLACGWHRPEDISLDDLFGVYSVQAYDGIKLKGSSVFTTLIEILGTKYGSRLKPEFSDMSEWTRRVVIIRTERLVATRAANSYASESANDCGAKARSQAPVIGTRVGDIELSSDEHFKRLAKCSPALAHPERLARAVSSAHGDFDFEGNLTYWCEIEAVYMSQMRENVKGVRAALGYLNLYLFYYLPVWYIENKSTNVQFPSTPDKLVGAVFVSRLLNSDEPLPKTLMEFMNERRQLLNWSDSSYYGVLNQIEGFFEFIIRNHLRLRNASKFRQPFGQGDFPKTHRPLGTDKIPMPRRLLSIFISYLQAYRGYVQHIADQRIAGNIADELVARLNQFGNYIDVKAHVDEVGYVPIVFVKGRVVPLWWVPGFPMVDWMQLKSGERALLPHPHALNQIAVAVYTGLRHNHIQWLDAEKFDSHVSAEDGFFSYLYVNTDKVKMGPWLPEVNAEVIEILRDQLRWRDSIAAHGFGVKQFYNNNPKTSYPKFLPLFSYSNDGRPHPDSAYASSWRTTILGLQTFLNEIIELIDGPVPVLCRLAPPGVKFREINQKEKFQKFKDIKTGKIALNIITEITPHSARAGVVSELIRFIPASLIGELVTGQTEGTVYHYVVQDKDELKRDQVHQAMHLRQLAREQSLGIIYGDTRADNSHIKADEVNSRLARSIKVSVPETFARYGCISLCIGEMKPGREILEERGIGQAAFNKTEICPYGNMCPPSLVQELRGFRRCSLCPYAIRSVDHLPAVCAKKQQVAEELSELDRQVVAASQQQSVAAEELDSMETERQRVGEDLAGWELNIEILELTRKRLEVGDDGREWVVERPEVLVRQLKRVTMPSNSSDYLLKRLAECISYPGFQSPKISRQFDMLRRRILVKAGASLDEVLSLDYSVDSAAECVGLIRTIAAAHQLSASDIFDLLTNNSHRKSVFHRDIMRLEND